MPTNIDQAKEIVKKALPTGTIQKVVSYNGLFIFQVFTDDPFEGEMDPFYSVDQKTGTFAGFPLLTHPNLNEIVSLFSKV
jgi:hypothetical protein